MPWIPGLVLCIAVGLFILLMPRHPKSAEQAAAQQGAIREAVALVQSGENPMAGIQALRNLESEFPENMEVKYHLGVFSVITGQYDKAIKRLEEVCGDPDWQQACYYLARSYVQTGDTTNFKRVKEKVRTLFPDSDTERDINTLFNP